MSKGKRQRPGNEYQLRSLDFSQTVLFVHTTQVAVGLFSLPRIVVESAGHSGWIAVLLNGAFSQIGLLIMLLLLRRFRNLSLYEIMRQVLGRWIGSALGLAFAVYCICVAGMVSRSYVEVVQTWLFPTTNTKMFYVLLIMPALYCATGGARTLGRFAIITFFGTIWMILFLLRPLSMMQTDYLFPLWDSNIPSLAKATWNVFTANIGFETIMLIYPFIQQKNKALLAASIGNWITTAVYFFTVVIAIGFFGESFIQNIMSPTLAMFQVVQIPLLQRIEHIGISTWSFLAVSTVAVYMWGAGRFLFEISKWKESVCISLFIPLLYTVSILPQDVYLLSKLEQLINWTGAAMAFGLPTLLLLVAIIRRKRAEDPNQSPAQEGAA
ncbi:MAG: GerAB/ArcD/ProY family transporter [Tumebacillaceae bacterium]